ncbi:MAG: LysM peptidoglycan-binding domain-containing protein [Aristaeellaceae bacterium]
MKDHTHRAPQDKVCGYEYTVRRGDSFYLIANRLGIPLRDLLEANSDINPARLMVGDVLCIPMEEDDMPPQPESPAVPEAPEAPVTPAVPETPEEPPVEAPEEAPEESEENLDAPAVLPEGPVDEAISVCPEENRYALRRGETVADVQLRANLNRYTLERANPGKDLERLNEGETLCVPDASIACPAPSAYTLQAEDTLESIALRLNVSLASLLRANPCLAPSEFTAGRTIRIP